MEAASLLDALERWKKSNRPPLPEPLASAVCCAVCEQKLSREAFARLGWMSPEQARGKPLEPGSDVFSIAVGLCELLTGSPPFASVSELALGELTPPKVESGSLAAVLAQALAPNPKHRFPSAAELRAALEVAAPPAAAEALAQWVAGLPAAVVAAEPRPVKPPRRIASMAALISLPVIATFAGLWAYESHQLQAQQAAADALKPCELVTDPPGAMLYLDGAQQPDRAPTVLRLEPGREYQVELRSQAGVVVRRIRNQKRLVVRLLDGAVLENDVYGWTPRVKPATAAAPAPSPVKAPLAAAPPVDEKKADHTPAYDLEAAPASFTLWPEHQLELPRETCLAVNADVNVVTPDHLPSMSGAALPLLGVFSGPTGMRTEVLGDVPRPGVATLCVFALTDRPEDHSRMAANVWLQDGKQREVKQPLVHVEGNRRVLVRSFPPGRFTVKVTGPANGPRPVMVLEHTDGTPREVLVLGGASTEVQAVKWAWFTVPVRTPDAALRFSVAVEQVR